MIYFKLRVTNPWSPIWKLLKNFNGQITRTKAWEFNVYRSNELLGIEFEYTIRTDHAGISLTLSLLNFTLEFKTYDIRHWDHKDRKWSNITYAESSRLF
jgi:hypothetical protein